jgi:hypothetical protein
VSSSSPLDRSMSHALGAIFAFASDHAYAVARGYTNHSKGLSEPAKVLAALLEKLRSSSARGRRGGLAVVRTMTERKGGA